MWNDGALCKRSGLVFGVWFMKDDSYFVLEAGPNAPMETETSPYPGGGCCTLKIFISWHHCSDVGYV